MTCLRSIPAGFIAVLLSLLAVGCAVKQGGMAYEFSNGLLIREYNAPLEEVYQAGMHGVYSKFVLVEEKDKEGAQASISGVAALSGQPVKVEMQQSGPAGTLVSVRVGEKGDRAAAQAVHEALQRYLMP